MTSGRPHSYAKLEISNMRRYMSHLLFGVAFVVLLSPVCTSAQFFGGTSPEITFDPLYPDPSEEVTATLSTNTFNQFGASIRWFINGTEVPSAENRTSVTFTAGAMGQEQRVQAAISGSDINATIERTLVVRDVDIIIESDAIVPAFYEGRALPALGNAITAVALPQFGNTVDPNSLFYTWSINNRVLFGGPQQGMDRAVIEPNRTAPDRVLSLTVSSPSGERLVKKAVRLGGVSPILHIYIDNPLRGVMPIAVKTTVLVPGEEVGLYAVPYYMSRSVKNEEDAEHRWVIDGRTAENPSVDPFAITLRREEVGVSTLGFALQSLDDFLQRVSREISIVFE